MQREKVTMYKYIFMFIYIYWRLIFFVNLPAYHIYYITYKYPRRYYNVRI